MPPTPSKSLWLLLNQGNGSFLVSCTWLQRGAGAARELVRVLYRAPGEPHVSGNTSTSCATRGHRGGAARAPLPHSGGCGRSAVPGGPCGGVTARPGMLPPTRGRWGCVRPVNPFCTGWGGVVTPACVQCGSAGGGCSPRAGRAGAAHPGAGRQQRGLASHSPAGLGRTIPHPRGLRLFQFSSWEDEML